MLKTTVFLLLKFYILGMQLQFIINSKSLTDSMDHQPKSKASGCLFLQASQLYPKIASYLTQTDRLYLHSTNSIIKEITSTSSYWGTIQLSNGDNKYLVDYLQWFAKYIRLCKPTKIAISLYELNKKFEAKLINALMEGAVDSVTSFDIYCESQDVHLASSLCFPNIQQLTIRSKCVTNELVQFMAENLKNLHSLVVIKNDLEFTCKNLSRYMPNPMEKLVIKPYVVIFQQIELMTAKSQDTLRQIQIDVEECSEEAIIKILKPLRKLEKLRLYHLQNLERDEELFQVLSQQTKIQQIALTKVYNFELKRILHVVSSKHLLSLDINDSKFVHDNDIARVAEECSNLRELNLSWCNGITCKGLIAVVQKCLNLEVFHITGIKDSKDCIFGDLYVNLLKIFNEQKFSKIKNNVHNHPELKQNGHIYEPDFFFTSPPHFQKIKTLRKLRFLDCQSCNGVSDNILKIIYIVNPTARTYNYYGNYMGLFPNDNQSTFC